MSSKELYSMWKVTMGQRVQASNIATVEWQRSSCPIQHGSRNTKLWKSRRESPKTRYFLIWSNISVHKYKEVFTLTNHLPHIASHLECIFLSLKWTKILWDIRKKMLNAFSLFALVLFVWVCFCAVLSGSRSSQPLWMGNVHHVYLPLAGNF